MRTYGSTKASLSLAVGVGAVEEVATGAFGGAFALLQLDLRLPAFAAEPAKFFGARQRHCRARLQAFAWLHHAFHRVAVAIARHASTTASPLSGEWCLRLILRAGVGRKIGAAESGERRAARLPYARDTSAGVTAAAMVQTLGAGLQAKPSNLSFPSHGKEQAPRPEEEEEDPPADPPQLEDEAEEHSADEEIDEDEGEEDQNGSNKLTPEQKEENRKSRRKLLAKKRGYRRQALRAGYGYKAAAGMSASRDVIANIVSVPRTIRACKWKPEKSQKCPAFATLGEFKERVALSESRFRQALPQCTAPISKCCCGASSTRPQCAATKWGKPRITPALLHSVISPLGSVLSLYFCSRGGTAAQNVVIRNSRKGNANALNSTEQDDAEYEGHGLVRQVEFKEKIEAADEKRRKRRSARRRPRRRRRRGKRAGGAARREF